MPIRPLVRSTVAASLALAASLSLGAIACSSEDEKGPWQLVWSDEFDGTALDTSKWGYQTGDGFGTEQLDYDTNRTENVSLDGEGMLHITARREDYEGRKYTSGRITTAGKFQQTHGRFEARMKLPLGTGMWPAFWMIGSNHDSVGWPKCGEIDIMEYRGSEPTIAYGALHGSGYSAGSALSGRAELPAGRSYAEDFHVFAVEWEEGVIRFYRDDDLYMTREAAKMRRDQAWAFEHDFNIILNLALGGHYGPPPTDDTVFPASVVVDYVRVYAR